MTTKNFSMSGTPVIHIRPSGGWLALEWRELWEYRELLSFLIWRDIAVRYKQTAIGAGWVILQPLLTMVVFTLVFGNFAQIPSDGLPYPIFTFTALLPWNLFAQAVGRSGTSLVGNANLISKVYFPRLIVPLAAALAPVADFAIAFVILILMMLVFGIAPGVGILALPLFLALALATALAVSLWLAALNVRYHDVAYVIPFLMQIWMYASPVAYPVSIVPPAWRLVYSLNPMAGVIEGFRWALLGKTGPDWTAMLVSGAVVLALLAGGVIYFKRMEETFADVI
jgi:lipopolysaccharide transport system permease protein